MLYVWKLKVEWEDSRGCVSTKIVRVGAMTITHARDVYTKYQTENPDLGEILAAEREEILHAI